MLFTWHEAKHSIYPAPLSKGMKSYVQVGREWIIHKDHLWGLNYAHFKKSTMFGNTLNYMHEEQSCRLYKKPTQAPYKCVDILLHVATQPRVGLTSDVSEMQVKEGGCKSIYHSSTEEVRSMCRPVTQVSSGYNPEDTSQTMKAFCWMFHTMVVFFQQFSLRKYAGCCLGSA